jgi:hypothetical protein
MKIKLDGILTDIDGIDGRSNGNSVRAKLPNRKDGDRYLLWRERDGGDEPVASFTEVFEGDSIYSTPPCHGA